MTLPERLIKLRKAAGLSQEEVADKLEVTRQTVSKWETGQSSPDLDKVLPLCSLYNVTPDELLHDGGSEEADEQKAKDGAARAEELFDKSAAKKKTIGILSGIMLYFVAIAFIMVAIPVAKFNPIIASAIFLLVLALATMVIIYSAIIYRKKSEVREKVSREDKINESVNSVLALITLVIYLAVSFMTMAWHITWIIWIIYALVTKIVDLIFLVSTGKSASCGKKNCCEKEEKDDEE